MTHAADDAQRIDLSIFDDLIDLSHAPDGKYVAKALLGQQYFPFVKSRGEELPPLFGSTSLSLIAATRLVDSVSNEKSDRRWVEFRARRFDGLSRRLGLPHPVPYSRLVLHLSRHWESLQQALGSEASIIFPRRHADGRLIQMNYDTAEESHERHTTLAIGNEFVVTADVSNCFPSIYTHAIDWALRGKSDAKRSRFDGSWQAETDKLARATMDGETKGLLIGPAVSNVLAEIVMQAVDRRLGDFSFTRAVDDYTAYCKTREDAERFVTRLQSALDEFKLDVNRRKTTIRSMRQGLSDVWLADVRAHLPRGNLRSIDIVQFMQQAEHIAGAHPNKSVMKYAVKSVLSAEHDRDALVLKELVRLAFFHPHLLPLLSGYIWECSEGDLMMLRGEISGALELQFTHALDRQETDSVLWLVYILQHQLSSTLPGELVERALNIENDLIWLALTEVGNVDAGRVAERVRELEYADRSDFDSHWLVRYEYFQREMLDPHEEYELAWMSSLRSSGVAFIERAS